MIKNSIILFYLLLFDRRFFDSFEAARFWRRERGVREREEEKKFRSV